MICPKCNVSNDDIYSFCVECGTPLPRETDASSEAPTVVQPSGNLDETLVMPSSDDFDKTLVMPPDKIVQTPSEDFDKTQYSPPPPNSDKNQAPPPTVAMPPEDIPATQHYSPANTNENEPPETVMMSGELPPTIVRSGENLSAAQQFIPSESVETAVNPQFQMETDETPSAAAHKPKKSRKFLWIGAIILLLLGGGIATAYFLHQPGQSSRSYQLTDKHDDTVLQFDGQNNEFSMVVAGDDKSQKWQITPETEKEEYFRFVNRNLGGNESLEVVDDSRDSSVMMAQSLNDVGQFWAITNVQGDYYRITNKWLGDVKSLAHKKRYYFFLRMRDSGDKDGQLWKKIPAGSGGFNLVNKQYGDTISLRAIDKGDYKDKLVMKSDDYGVRQWNLTDVGGGFYKLEAVGTGKSLAVNSGKNDRVSMAASGSSAEQKWKMTPAGGDYFLLTNESLGDGKSLEAVTYSKYYLEMEKSSDDPGQLWKLSRTDK